MGLAQHKAFEELKQYLIDLTTLTLPAPGAPLLLYVAASHSAVSVALVQEKLEGQIKKQAPVYFVSEVLSFSSIPHNCSFIAASEGYYEEQRSYWKDWKVGCRA
jgi:hypothetical protein